MGQVAWGYVEMGTSLLRARIDSDGSIRTAAGSDIEPENPAELLWMTRRAVDSTLGETGVHIDSLSSIALVGPNGGATDAARAIAHADARDSRVYTTEELLAKCGSKITLADVVAFYADEAEIAA